MRLNDRGIERAVAGLLAVIALLATASLTTIPLSQLELESGHLISDARESFVRLFSLDAEGNIPTWLSSAMLLAASALLGLIASYHRTAEHTFAKHWALLAIVFLYISLDETARIHEALNTPVRAILPSSGFLHFGWVLVGTLFVVIFFVAYFRFLFDLPRPTRTWFLIAGFVFVAGAIGFESLSAHFFWQSGYRNARYLLASNVEEVMEMIGIVIFLYALLTYINRELPKPVLAAGLTRDTK